MSSLLTHNPVALRYLFDETLFALPPDTIEGTDAGNSKTTLIHEKQAGVSTPALPSWKTQGNIGNTLAFFVMDPNHAFLSETSWLAFTKTLQALGQPLEEVTLFNLAQCTSPSEAQSLLTYVQATQLIGLGVKPQQWDIHQTNFPDATFLWTSSFEEMFEDVEKKRTFWNQIKQFLGK